LSGMVSPGIRGISDDEAFIEHFTDCDLLLANAVCQLRVVSDEVARLSAVSRPVRVWLAWPRGDGVGRRWRRFGALCRGQ